MCLEVDRKAWFIMIHKFKAKDINILLDVNSGGVHVIDDITYDVLDYVEPPFADECPSDVIEKLSEKYSAEDIKESYSEIVELYNDKLFHPDIQADIFDKMFTGIIYLILSREKQ